MPRRLSGAFSFSSIFPLTLLLSPVCILAPFDDFKAVVDTVNDSGISI